MNTDVIGEACANIASTSRMIDTFCKDPNSRCSPYAAGLLERMSWELHRLAGELQELNYFHVL